MKSKSQISKIFLACLALPLLTFSMTGYGFELKSSYDRGYDNGYDDGYEDCMYDNPCPPKIFHNGFYLGAGVGYEGFQVNHNSWIDNNDFGRFNTHANGWNGRLFGGYSWNYRNFMLGGEIFGSISSAEGKDSVVTNSYNSKISVGSSFGASVLPGYKMPTGQLLYGRLGYISTDFTVKDSSTGGSNTTHQWQGGFNVGLGFEIPLTKGFSTRMEYDYIKYGTFNNNGTTGSQNTPRDNRGSLDLLMRF